MKKKAAIKLLAAPGDQARVQGILQQLRDHGVRISEGGHLRKNDFVLAVLSERFYENEELKSRLFAQLALGADNILPLNLEDGPVPREIMDLLFSRNIIALAGRDEGQVAERILSAIPEKKNYMPAVFSAAAVMLLLLAGLFLWQSLQKPEPVPEIQVTEPVVYPFGITEEDLEKIQSVVIVGDRFTYHTIDDIRYTDWPEIYDYAYETWEDDGRHWYSTEDGHEYTLTRYDDLRFLELMPNLRRLRMALVDVDPEMLPDLSGSANLNYVSIHDCGITDVQWLTAKYLAAVDITGTPVADYSPLNRCAVLLSAYIDGHGKYTGDISGFAPPDLRELTISNLQQGAVDLTNLSGCTKLSSLRLDSLNVTDLDFLTDMYSMNTLVLEHMPVLEDISAVASLTGLRELRIRRCEGVTDYTAISQCAFLEIINIEREHWIPADSSFLNGLSRLQDIGLFGLNLNNMDFLGTLGKVNNISLGFCGDIQDYSGLADREYYRSLHVNPRSSGGPFGDYALVAPYLRDVSVGDLELYNCTNVELSDLPQVRGELTLTGGDLENLSGLNDEYLGKLELRNMQYLRSLEGLENLPKYRGYFLQLSILGCPRLMDYGALYDAEIFALNLVDMYSLPDFGMLKLKSLSLESIRDMEDLSCLEPLDKNVRYQFRFPGLDDLKDLSVLRDFHGGALYVPPQVADQAQELVDQGNFARYEICYPEFGWNPLDEEAILLSLEELETLPKAVLNRVSRVWIAGDEVVDPNRYELREEWVGDRPIPVLYDHETGQTRRVAPGTITDFSMLADLTRVREMRLINQPLTDLEGIQHFSELICFEASFCEDLADVSALFTQQALEEIRFRYSNVDSIQGIQNLPRLRWLGIAWTQVSDLSPLAEVDYTRSMEWDGFGLEMENCLVEDLSALSAVPVFSYLGVYGYPAENWMEHVQQTSIRAIGAQMSSDEGLQAFIRQHPELQEMHIEAGYQLTDLTPLLELEQLYYVHIWDGPYPAVNSLNGLERRFQLDVD